MPQGETGETSEAGPQRNREEVIQALQVVASLCCIAKKHPVLDRTKLAVLALIYFLVLRKRVHH